MKKSWRSLCPSKTDDVPLDRFEVRRELGDFNYAVLVDRRKMLPRVRRRPPDFDVLDSRGLAEPDVLLERRRSKGSAARDRTVNGSCAAGGIRDRHFDPCADRG